MSVHSAPVKLGEQKSNLRNKSIFQPEWVTWFFFQNGRVDGPKTKIGWKIIILCTSIGVICMDFKVGTCSQSCYAEIMKSSHLIHRHSADWLTGWGYVSTLWSMVICSKSPKYALFFNILKLLIHSILKNPVPNSFCNKVYFIKFSLVFIASLSHYKNGDKDFNFQTDKLFN